MMYGSGAYARKQDPLASVGVRATGRILEVFWTLSPTTRKVVSRKRLPGIGVQVVRQDRYVYVACGFHGFVIVDIIKPVKPRFVASASGIGNVRGLEVMGDMLVVSVGRYKFRVYDVREPAQLAPLTLRQMGKRLAAWRRAVAARLRSLPEDLGKRHLKNLPRGKTLPSSLLRNLPPKTTPRAPARPGPGTKLMDFPPENAPARRSGRKGPLRSRVMDVRFAGKPVPRGASRGSKGSIRSRVLDVRFTNPRSSKSSRRSIRSGVMDVDFSGRRPARPAGQSNPKLKLLDMPQSFYLKS